ncbi:MAG: radical SAM protein [Desulfomonilaceae bacterium]|nr:radical SAM protein [Desulfomonilaceae bacterium]
MDDKWSTILGHRIPHGERVRYAFNSVSKPYFRGISPGCVTCGEGSWACVFIAHACTRRCDFCLREPTEAFDFVPYADRNIKIHSVERLIAYIQHFGFKGVAFSGGEPFLAFERLLGFVFTIRRALGTQPYLWAYTNGDLVTEDKLVALAKAGLDEIRFDISARDYDLTPIYSASQHIPTVTVEIPAIPEDADKVKRLLPTLCSVGVKHLNLHQLILNSHNQAALEARGYTILRNELFADVSPALESQAAAIEILNYVSAEHLPLAVNYCSHLYKYLFQQQGFRRLYSPMVRSEEEELTPTGFLRKIADANHADANEAADQVRERDGDPVTVTYSEPSLKSIRDAQKYGASSAPHPIDPDVAVLKNITGTFILANETAELFFRLLFVERRTVDGAFQEACDLFAPDSLHHDALRSDLREFQRRLQVYEYLPYTLESPNAGPQRTGNASPGPLRGHDTMGSYVPPVLVEVFRAHSSSVLMHPGFNLSSAEEAIRMSRAWGRGCCLELTVGRPGETVPDLIETLTFVMRHGDYVDFRLSDTLHVYCSDTADYDYAMCGFALRQDHDRKERASAVDPDVKMLRRFVLGNAVFNAGLSVRSIFGWKDFLDLDLNRHAVSSEAAAILYELWKAAGTHGDKVTALAEMEEGTRGSGLVNDRAQSVYPDRLPRNVSLKGWFSLDKNELRNRQRIGKLFLDALRDLRRKVIVEDREG